MEESKKIISGIGKCLCLQSPYKHFIMVSLGESIENREKEIDIIRKSGEDIRKINITSYKDAEAMIYFLRLTKEELTKVRNMVDNIPDCKNDI